MKHINRLSQLPQGGLAYIDSINTKGSMRRRLLDMGFTKGASVQCLFKGPSGDPTAYMVRRAVIALRKEDADCIMAELTEKMQECPCKSLAAVKLQ